MFRDRASSRARSSSISSTSSPGIVGQLEIRVEDARLKIDSSVEYGYINTPRGPQLQLGPPNNVGENVFSWTNKEAFIVPIDHLQSDVEICLLHKRVVKKDKIIAHIKIGIPTLQDAKVHHDWFPLMAYVSAKKLQKNIKQEVSQVGEIRIYVKFNPVSKEKKGIQAKGIVVESKWTHNTNGGTVLNHHTWMKNPQFILDVSQDDVDLNIRVFQPEGVDQRVSFYTIEYDGSADGYKKVLCSIDEIVKVENFHAPLFNEDTKAPFNLDKGRYAIVPCTENLEYSGNFSLNVWTKKDNEKDLISLSPAKEWISKIIKGQWTKQTSGGGDIASSTEWRNNPQYLLSLSEPSIVSVVLGQQDKELALGLYVLKYKQGNGKRVLEYKDEVCKTDSFKFNLTTGVSNKKLPEGDYVIIPCTSKPGKEGFFDLNVFCNNNFELKELTDKHKTQMSINSQWDEETAAGAPNHGNFTKNPKFKLEIPEQIEDDGYVIIELSVNDTNDSIGFMVVRQLDFSPDDIIYKPEGWVAVISVFGRLKITKEDKGSSFIVIPSTFKPDCQKEFIITAYSDLDIKFSNLN